MKKGYFVIYDSLKGQFTPLTDETGDLMIFNSEDEADDAAAEGMVRRFNGPVWVVFSTKSALKGECYFLEITPESKPLDG